jgi:hypothetical protein
MIQPEESAIDILELAKSLVYVTEDQQLILGQLWEKQTVVLVFLILFACISCRAHAAQVCPRSQTGPAIG